MVGGRSVAVGLAALVGLTGCGGGGGGPTRASTPQAPGGASSAVVALDAATFESRVLASPRPSLVEFWSPTCPACQSMVAIVERLASDFDGRAIVGTVDVSQQAALANGQRISAVPTFVFFRGGVEISRQVGSTSYDALAARLQSLVTAP
jgi:thioredoxin 1